MPHETETQIHIFECYKSIPAYKEIETKLKKSLLKLSNKSSPKKKSNDMNDQIQKLSLGRRLGLDKVASGMTGIDFYLSAKSQAKFANKVLALLYILIWISRSATANISIASGIK
ncbi:11529_t:CDS:1 [Acaulospora morrowiae]|uniref:11529_t:CDS:1 n=1 Tax=Acaulospora morrowiae TaxID=94023 RepID=A0A9N9AVV1_9GLOM|nr:11529_t:CDS:1 [Acaulospora morrowiae]